MASTLLAAAGIACAMGGFVLAYAPLGALRRDASVTRTREVRLLRVLGLALMAIGAYVTVTSLVAGTPMLPAPRPVPTPTLITRIL